MLLKSIPNNFKLDVNIVALKDKLFFLIQELNQNKNCKKLESFLIEIHSS